VDNKVYAIADVGGTKILLLLVGPDQNVILRQKLPTPPEATPELVVKVIEVALSRALQEVAVSPQSLAGLGVCIAALLDFEGGVIYEAPNLDWHEPIPFATCCSAASVARFTWKTIPTQRFLARLHTALAIISPEPWSPWPPMTCSSRCSRRTPSGAETLPKHSRASQ